MRDTHTEQLLLAIADMLIAECGMCNGSGKHFAGFGPSTPEHGGNALFCECDHCGPLRRVRAQVDPA